MASHDLKSVEVRSGVNSAGKPFCHVVVNGGDLLAQMTPTEVREMALQWLQAAEAAESDAAVYQLLRTKVQSDHSAAGLFLAELRGIRDGG